MLMRGQKRNTSVDLSVILRWNRRRIRILLPYSRELQASRQFFRGEIFRPKPIFGRTVSANDFLVVTLLSLFIFNGFKVGRNM